MLDDLLAVPGIGVVRIRIGIHDGRAKANSRALCHRCCCNCSRMSLGVITTTLRSRSHQRDPQALMPPASVMPPPVFGQTRLYAICAHALRVQTRVRARVFCFSRLISPVSIVFPDVIRYNLEVSPYMYETPVSLPPDKLAQSSPYVTGIWTGISVQAPGGGSGTVQAEWMRTSIRTGGVSFVYFLMVGLPSYASTSTPRYGTVPYRTPSADNDAPAAITVLMYKLPFIEPGSA